MTTPTRSTTTRSRIPFGQPTGLLGRIMTTYCRRTYGDVLEPSLVMWHHRRVLRDTFAYERRIARWDRLDPTHAMLALMGAAGSIGCAWCLDFAYYHAHAQDLDLEKIRAVPAWRDSDLFDDTERAVLAYAEAMTATPSAVTDEQVTDLRRRFDDATLVELTQLVAVENLRSRFNAAMGLTSQGFSDRCELAP